MTKATVSKGRIAWGRYLLVFFVAAWMFVLGVLVGRGTAPVHFDIQALQKDLAELRDAMTQTEREAVEKAMRGEDAPASLEFYEALKADRPDAAEAMIAVQPPPDTEVGAAAAAAGGTPPHKSRLTLKPKSARAPTASSSEPPPSPSVPAGAQPHLTIQVAALKDGAAAERIVANLKKDGYSAYLSRIVIPDKGLWFRIRVGAYADPDQAAADMARLARERQNPILVENRNEE